MARSPGGVWSLREAQTMNFEYHAIWERIQFELGNGLPEWKTRIDQMKQVGAVEARARGRVFSNDDVFKGLVLSVLSSNTNWAVIENLQGELAERFGEFELERYARSSDQDITALYNWFIEQRSGTMVLRRCLFDLRYAAQRLLDRARQFNSLHQYLEILVAKNGDLSSVARALGSNNRSSRDTKLPGLGVRLAAEFLKNIGYDVAKPDRHICRAVGSFGWMEFNNWPNRSGWSSPSANEGELIEVMGKMAGFAAAVTVRVCYVDNALWLLCAQSGLHFRNEALSSLRRNALATA